MLAVGIAAGREPERSVFCLPALEQRPQQRYCFLEEEAWCSLARQSRACCGAGSCTGAGAAGVTSRSLSCSQTHPHRAETLPVCLLAYWRGAPELPPLVGVLVPPAFLCTQAAVLELMLVVGLWKKEALVFGFLMAQHPLGAWAGQRTPAGHASLGQLNAPRGWMVGPGARKEPCWGGCRAGLHLGKAAPCPGSSHLLYPCSHGHHAWVSISIHTAAPSQGSAGWSCCPHPSWSREVTCYQVPSGALFLLPASGFVSSPCPSGWL